MFLKINYFAIILKTISNVRILKIIKYLIKIKKKQKIFDEKLLFCLILPT